MLTCLILYESLILKDLVGKSDLKGSGLYFKSSNIGERTPFRNPIYNPINSLPALNCLNYSFDRIWPSITEAENFLKSSPNFVAFTKLLVLVDYDYLQYVDRSPFH